MLRTRWRAPGMIAAVCTVVLALLLIVMAGLGLSGGADDSTTSSSASTDPTGTGTTNPDPATPAAPGSKTNDRAQLPPGQATAQATPTRLTGPLTVANGTQLGAAAPLNGIHQDQGSSIPLPDGHTLWIFADTFQLYNKPKFFITSSVAVSNPGSWQLTYAKTSQGIPSEFLPRTATERADRKDGDHYQAVWPTGSALLPDGRIIITYAKYRVLVKEQNFIFLGAGLFEYRYRSLDTLLNAGQATRTASDLWTVADGEVRSPVYVDGYVYFDQCRDLHCYPLRTTPDRITDRSSYRWWTGSQWSADPAQKQAISPEGPQPGGNASVVRLNSGGYAMADTELGAVSTTGLLWVAPHPWGPWSRAASFTFPRCPDPGCYGLNIHPAQSTDRTLRISYATNGVGPFVRVDDVPVSIRADSSSIRIR